MITIDSFDEVQAANGGRLHTDEDSRGGGFCISPETVGLAPLHLLWLRRLVAAW